MRTLSNGFLTAPGRYQARLVLSRGGEISGDAIRSLTITASALGSTDRLALGSSPAATLSGVVYAPGVSLLDQTVALYIGRQVSGALEEVPLGRYTITGAQEVDGAVTITGYDAMYTALETAYYPTITGATTAQAVLADVARAAGLSLVCDSFVADVSVSGVSTGYTLREMAGYMAALMGGNARIDGAGNLRVGWFTSTGLTLDGDQIYAGGAALAPENWSLGRLTCSVTTTTTTSDTDDDGNTIISSTDNTVTLTAGDGATGISLSTPWMTQTVLDGIFGRIGGFAYRAGQVSALADLRLEPGDLLTVVDSSGARHSFPVMSQTLEYDGGLRMTLGAWAESASDGGGNGTAGPLTQAVERYTAQLAMIKQLEAENLTAVTAKIAKLVATTAKVEDLTAVHADIDALEARTAEIEEAYIDTAAVQTLLAGYAKIDQLEAAQADIDDLEASTAKVEDLTAIHADIDSLEARTAEIEEAYIDTAAVQTLLADYAKVDQLETAQADIDDLEASTANIETLLAGEAGVGVLQAIHLTGKNVVIDDAVITDAMIADLSASKLTAGRINTDLIQVASDSGRLVLDGETIQISDAQRVRVQLGRDASADYNLYLWDAQGNLMWDAGGLYALGLHDGIIRDVAVAEDAAISGSKLDITSVASRLTEDGTLVVDSSRVRLDKTTLDVAYKTVSDNTAAAHQAAVDAQAKAEQAATDASAAQTKADQAANTAATAQGAADQAAADAASAQAAANTAKDNAAAAQSKAQEAQTAAQTAQAAADKAQQDYDTLASRANATEEDLAKAKENLTAAQSAAQAANSAASAAQAAAEQAQADATAAQSTADSAQSKADSAQAAADKAKSDAAAAQQAADQAQEAADKAQANIKAVETRTTTLETSLTEVQGQITSKIWQTDITEITDPLGGKVTTLEDQYSQIDQTLGRIDLSVGNLQTKVDEQGTEIESVTGKLSLYVEKTDTGQIVSMLNASADMISLTGNRVTIDSDKFKLAADGSIEATGGTIGGWSIYPGYLLSDVTYDRGQFSGNVFARLSAGTEDEMPGIYFEGTGSGTDSESSPYESSGFASIKIGAGVEGSGAKYRAINSIQISVESDEGEASLVIGDVYDLGFGAQLNGSLLLDGDIRLTGAINGAEISGSLGTISDPGTCEITLGNGSDYLNKAIGSLKIYGGFRYSSSIVCGLLTADRKVNLPDADGTLLSTESVGDFVLEQGSSGIWQYRKWNSGIMECWGVVTCDTVLPQVCYSDEVFPYQIAFTSIQAITCGLADNSTNDSNGWGWNARAWSTNTAGITVAVFNPSNNFSVSVNLHVSVHVLGAWE